MIGRGVGMEQGEGSTGVRVGERGERGSWVVVVVVVNPGVLGEIMPLLDAVCGEEGGG